MNPASVALGWVERGLVPDSVVRGGIRGLCRKRLRDLSISDAELSASITEAFVRSMREAPTAPLAELANEQHYEVPAEFFGLVLGPRRKYSCAWWPEGVADLAQAEERALEATCERAGLADGQRILELGCGWGSLTLWMAERYPASRILAVSNSHSQRAHIMAEAWRRGFSNVEVVTADMNTFEVAGRFDRIVSVEMFEHMRNWEALFGRVHGWLTPGGRFFMHVFCHRAIPYPFEDADASDWMARHFFSGGMMPSDDLALRVAGPMRLVERWRWDGTHYEKTANAWLENLDAARTDVMQVLETAYGRSEAALWLQRWRLFFMACAELFGHRDGQEWWVSHYLFERPA